MRRGGYCDIMLNMSPAPLLAIVTTIRCCRNLRHHKFASASVSYGSICAGRASRGDGRPRSASYGRWPALSDGQSNVG